MIDQIRSSYEISDDEALYIRQVTEQKVADPVIRCTVQAHHSAEHPGGLHRPGGPKPDRTDYFSFLESGKL